DKPSHSMGNTGGESLMRAWHILARRAVGVAIALTAAMATGATSAADYPERPVRVIAGYAAGGGGDRLVRYYAAKLEEATGQKFVVQNRVGANGKIATDFVLRAKPDGYTLLIH